MPKWSRAGWTSPDAMLLDNSALDRDAAIAAAIAFVEGKAGKSG